MSEEIMVIGDAWLSNSHNFDEQDKEEIARRYANGYSPPSPFLLTGARQPATQTGLSTSKSAGVNAVSLSLLCFHGLTNCFSRNSLVFKIFCVAPGVYTPNPSKERKNDPANR